MDQHLNRAEKLAGLSQENQLAVMGILNLTPDSFFDGGHYLNTENAIKQASTMIEEGSAILDIGAVSTRPFANQVSEEDEWNRLKKVLPAIRKKFPGILISVDTYRSSIARQSILEGADIINDISGGQFDEKIFKVISEFHPGYVMMHIRGNPQTMQQDPEYDDVVEEVISFFKGQLKKLNNLGVERNIILDPGFGFGKTVDHNYQLLHGTEKIRELGYPVLAGLSRKSMINKVLGTKPENALNGTTALNMLALQNGAQILRVHDVKPAMEVVRLFEMYSANAPNVSV